jgi:membrane-bound ClpP family serine protease
MTRLIRLAPAALLGLLLVSPASAQQAPPQADGMFVTVQNPISAAEISRIKGVIDAARSNPRKNIKKIVFDFNPEGKEAASDNYGDCGELANYIQQNLIANGVTTIAFVHGKTTRHTVLPVLACDDVVMSSGAQIGQVSSPEKPLPQFQIEHYMTVARIERAGAVLKMIDKDVRLVQARYRGNTIYADARKLDGKDTRYADVQRFGDQTPLPLSTGVELYGVEQARKFGLCKIQKEDWNEIKELYGLSDESIRTDPLGGQAIKPVRVSIEGTIDTALREKVGRQIKIARGRQENTFFFILETTQGGDPSAARSLADDIIALGNDKCRTIAFVPGKSPELAIFVAFACQEIVMYKGPTQEDEAVIGDFETMVAGQEKRRVNAEFVRQNLESIAEQTGRSKLIVQGLFDKNLEIVRARDNETGDRLLMPIDDLKAPERKGWVREATVKAKGTYLKLNATNASNLKIAKTIGNKDVNEVYAMYGVEAKDVRSSEPSWLDDFASFLRRTPVSILLVIVGIAGLVLELKAPGLIVPGVISAICFVLFFWAQTQLGGQLIYLAIMLFLLGLALLGIEIFLLPGFGVAGVSGILLILAGLVLAGLDKAPESTQDWVDLVGKMLRYGLTMAGAGVLAFILSRYLPKIPYANRLMLVPPEDQVDLDESSPLPGVDAAANLLGQVGTTTSMLRPSGSAKFGDRYIDVVTEGDFIAVGTPIQVVEVEGTRIVVKKI